MGASEGMGVDGGGREEVGEGDRLDVDIEREDDVDGDGLGGR